MKKLLFFLLITGAFSSLKSMKLGDFTPSEISWNARFSQAIENCCACDCFNDSCDFRNCCSNSLGLTLMVGFSLYEFICPPKPYHTVITHSIHTNINKKND
jgi:hypothetical protein